MSTSIPQSFSFTVSMDINSHPYLTSHMIQGVPVLPFCMVLEWFLQAVQPYFADYAVIVCENFHVLRGIKLPNFFRETTYFLVNCEKDATEEKIIASLSSLTQADGIYYRAELSAYNPTHSSHQNVTAYEPGIDSASWPCSVDEIYFDEGQEGYLPHGEHFRAISRLDQVSDQGGSAYLTGVQYKGWQGRWLIDPLVIDGVFQLAGLWGGRMLNKTSLPNSMERLLFYQQPLPVDEIFCSMRGRVDGNYRTRFDVVLLDKQHRIYVEIFDLQMFCYGKIGHVKT